MHTYKLHDEVYHPCDTSPFKVVGIREHEIEIEGDWSGGTYNVCEKDWVSVDKIKPYDRTKVRTYGKSGNPVLKVKDIKEKLNKYNDHANVKVLVNGKSYDFILSYGGGVEGETMEICSEVYFDVFELDSKSEKQK